jgi:hypothetical protein
VLFLSAPVLQISGKPLTGQWPRDQAARMPASTRILEKLGAVGNREIYEF